MMKHRAQVLGSGLTLPRLHFERRVGERMGKERTPENLSTASTTTAAVYVSLIILRTATRLRRF